MERGYQENFYTLYDKFRSHEGRLSKAEKILDALQRYSGLELKEMTCLDVGCSTGIITSTLAPHFKAMIGLDYDRTGLKLITPEQKEEVLFLNGDAMGLPFPDHSFDVIICAQVYEHVPSDLKLFAEMDRVLRPGGVVFFSGPNRVFPIEPHYYLPFLHWLPEKWSDRYLRLLGKGDHFYERSRSPWNLRKVLRNFHILDVTRPAMRVYAGSQINQSRKFYRFLSAIPFALWKLMLPLMPNYNWVLLKPAQPAARQRYEIIP